MSLNEPHVEDATLEWFEWLSCAAAHGAPFAAFTIRGSMLAQKPGYVANP